MDNEGIVVAEFDKNSRERVRVSLRIYHDIPLVDLRAFWQDEAGQWQPGKGLCIRRELLPKLKAAIEAAKRCSASPA